MSVLNIEKLVGKTIKFVKYPHHNSVACGNYKDESYQFEIHFDDGTNVLIESVTDNNAQIRYFDGLDIGI